MDINLDQLADRMLNAMRNYVSLAKAELNKRMDLLSQRLDSFPRPKDGKDADMAALGELVVHLVDERVTSAVTALPVPKDGLPGRNAEPGRDGAPGKDAVLPDIEALVRVEWEKRYSSLKEIAVLLVEKEIGKLPKPKDGIDGINGTNAVLPDIEALVKSAVDSIQRPRDGVDGKDAVLPDLVMMVKNAVAEIPRPADGRDGKDAILPDVKALVLEAVNLIPRPRDGVDGKDAVLPDIHELVAQAFKQYPRPRDGKDADMDAVADLVSRLVDEGIRAAITQINIPKPKDGVPGVDGRDAAELHILPSIDESKSYRRGVWASYRGGLIRAIRETSPLGQGGVITSGWEVMVEGVASVSAEQGEDPREIIIVSKLSSGVESRTVFKVPMIQYRGVWKEGQYEQGDVTTWGGSAWHCQMQTKDKPGISAAWKLMVKEGARGKDAYAKVDLHRANKPVEL